jgi:photosystem II stability/assembly factor-like uncharacterized protein
MQRRMLPHGWRRYLVVGLALLLALTGCASNLDISPTNSTDPIVRGRPLSNPGQHLHTIALNAVNPNVLYLGSHYGLFWSTDGGKTWPQPRGALNFVMVTSIASSPKDASVLAVVAISPTGVNFGQNGVQLSTDGGKSWHLINKGLPGNPPDAFFVVAGQASAQQFYVYVVQHGLFVTDNAGKTWRNITPPGQSQINMQGLLTDPTDPNRLLLGTGAGLFRSTNDGTTWTQTSAVQGTVLALASPRQLPQVVYCATDNGLYRSDDGGQRFGLIYAGTPFSALAAPADDPQTVYALSGQQFQASTDGGQTFTARATFGEANPSGLLVDPRNPQTLYVGFFYPAEALKSTNGGQTWQTTAS